MGRSKAELRAELRARVSGMSPDARAQESRQICRGLEVFLKALPPGVLASYSPLPSEVDPSGFESSAQALGWSVAWPTVRGDTLVFRIKGGATVQNALGVLEPSDAAPAISPSQFTICLVPGLGFTAEAYRLGRGKGYYDRWLVQLAPSAITLGLAFGVQVIQAIPRESHDVQLSGIAVAAGVRIRHE